MRPPSRATLGVLTAIGLFAAATRLATAAPAFEQLIDTATGSCKAAPAEDCIDRTWPLADTDGDGKLSQAEVNALHRSAAQWVRDRFGSGVRQEQQITLAVLGLFSLAGTDAVFGRFDADKDGALTRGEVFTDFRFDGRPFPELVMDPQAVEWPALAARFGQVGMLLLELLPPSHRAHGKATPKR